MATTVARTEEDFWRKPEGLLPEDELSEAMRIIRCQLSGMPGGRKGLLAWRKSMVITSSLPGDQSNTLLAMSRFVPPIAQMADTLDRLQDDFDLVHAFNISWENPMVAAWRYARREDKPLIITPFAHLGTSKRDRVARNSTMDHQLRMLHDAQAVLALTEVEQQGLVQLGIPANQVHIVGSGVDPLPSFPDPAELLHRYAVTEPFVIFVGRASREKGAIDAAEAILHLRREGVSISLCLVGQVAPEFSRFYDRLSKEQQQHIRPLGIVSEADKHALLSAANSLALPSKTDSFGIVLLEAWLHEKPVVGARAGGITSVIQDGINGYLVEFGDVSGLATAIGKLLDDRTLNQDMGRLGRERVAQKYTWDRVGGRVLDSYRHALVK